MAKPPWKDALVRAQRRSSPAAAPAAPAAIDRLAAAPGLRQLLDERQALERQMQGLTGGDAADPRYAVEPLDRRRAALAAWSESRDMARQSRRAPASAFAPQAPPLRSTAADQLRGTAADSLRGTSADTLRATPGELPSAARPTRIFEQFERLTQPANDDLPLRALGRPPEAPPESRRARRDGIGDGPPLGEAGRQLGEAGRAPDGQRAKNPPETERPRGGADALDRRLARARDLAARARRGMDAAERALDHARDAIPADWQERARERIPGLGKADTYVRETAKKLAVLVGAVEEIGEKADRMRAMARDMRELKEADESNDEARRERALDRLKAKRRED